MSKMIRVESCGGCLIKKKGIFLTSYDVCPSLATGTQGYTNIENPAKILPNCPLEAYPKKKKFEDWYYTPESVEFENSDDILPVKFAELWKIAQGEVSK